MNKITTNVAIVLDTSGSMFRFLTRAKEVVNDIITTFRQVERDGKQRFNIQLFHFSEQLHAVASFDGICPSGNTALFDATVNATKFLPHHLYKDATLVIVITDGVENASREYSGSRFAQFIRDKQNDDHHTFVFNVPPGYKNTFVKLSDVHPNNVNEWEQTEAGFKEVEQKTFGGICSYTTLRSKGETHSKSFYAQTDASKIKPSDLYNKNSTWRYDQYTVGKEATAKEFTERETGKKYVIGQLFYQLMKTERVQENKEVVIQDKATKLIYDGPEIRKLIGIPAGKRVRVDPGNHAMFDVFIQSTSVNRILPRGTKVLIDKDRVSNLKPTWDHTAVKPKKGLTEQQRRLIGG
jgi:hypothetical protein